MATNPSRKQDEVDVLACVPLRNGLSRASALALLVVLMTVLAASPARASKLVYIFDASGSMWGQIDGTAKIDIARQALSQLVRGIPQGTEVGLVAYGHRVKGDCADIETLVPTGPLDADALTAAVQSISPKGMTPMADSVRLVAGQLKASGGDAAIVLISDGKETCDPDPCQAVRELKDAGIDFTLHVIGFDVGGETEAQLQCMAEAGGGGYFPAKNAGDFGAAVQEVQKKILNNLVVSAARNGQPLAVSVAVLRAGTGEVVDSRDSTEQDPAGFSLEPGVYDLRVKDEWGQEGAPEQAVAGVEVTEDQVREVAVEFGGGALEVWAYRNGQPFAADVVVTDSAGQENYKQTYPDRPALFELAGGTYHLAVKDEWGTGAVIDLGTIQIGSGTVKKEVSFDAGILEVWAYRGGKPYVADVKVTDASGKDEYRQTYEADPARFELLPGTYQVTVKDEWGDGRVIDLGAVEVGTDTVVREVSFD